MKNLLLTTALVAASATSAFADGHASELFHTEAEALNIYGSEFIGARIYVSETGATEAAYAEADAEWDDIGEVNDLILTRDGDIEAVLVDIGGFLGIGERQVALKMDAIQIVNDDVDDPNDYFLVVKGNVAELENAPEYQSAAMMQEIVEETDETADAAEADVATDAAETEVAMDDTATADVDATEMETASVESMLPEDLTSEDLTGAAVYDANDAWIGEVSELIVSVDGQIEKAIIDVGGFIGIGEKPVALTMDQLDISRTDGGDEFMVRVKATEEELEAMPTYEG